MFWRIEVKNRPEVRDPVGEGIKRDAIDLSVESIRDVKMVQVYILEAEKLTGVQIKKICEELLSDPVIQEYEFGHLEDKKFRRKPKSGWCEIETAYNPGVMDPWEESTKKGIRDIGIDEPVTVKTGRRYLIKGKLAKRQLEHISQKLLYNKVIQHIVKIQTLKKTLSAHKEVSYQFQKKEIEILALTHKQLLALSKDMQLSLTLDEMLAIRAYYSRLGRNPTDCELETIAQTWSEHCVHKTMRGTIEYREKTNGKWRKKIIRNLLKSTIMDATRKLNKSWCVSVFKDNAGIIRFDGENNICFKVETHNHPSALDPYGGAGTGIGGVIRDVLGVGLGAKPIMNTDVFCFGMPDLAYAKLPKGLLHPKRIMKGVVSGVRDYGNRMGIPTANGAVLFDRRYTGNPLVYCGTLGIMPRKYSFKKVKPGEYVVAVGGRTGRDGIHGATFSSIELSHESETVSSGAVQIGNAITEKKILDTLLAARDRNLYTAITDCGAGGFSSAVGEMGQDIGVRVELEKVPLKYNGLSYTEIWISEAQERMVIAVREQNLKEILKIFEAENVEAAVIGRFTNSKRLEVFYKQERVCNLEMDFLHNGLPKLARKAIWQPPNIRNTRPANRKNRCLTKSLLAVLSDLNICSKEWIIRQYDHEVQGMSVLKPLAGADNDGPQDAAVIRPLADSRRGIAVSCGINSRYSEIDTYWMAVSCMNEALRQIIAVGGNLKQVAVLDNFSWANTSKPKVLGDLVRACYGCRDASLAYGVPFISGKDSLNNEYKVGRGIISIPATLLISAMGIIEDVNKVVSSDAKSAGNLIYCIGTTYDELGASSYYNICGSKSRNIPKDNFKTSRNIFELVSRCAALGLVRSAHDCSDGGLAVTLAEMAFSGNLGMSVDLKYLKHGIPRKKLEDDVLLFSESNSRFVIEVEPKHKSKLENTLKDIAFSRIGELRDDSIFLVSGLNGSSAIKCDIEELKTAWQKPLKW
ncbi:MAG: phosphoribosylformylglycinamidine synthase subunit PurL [Candidatus Omnitrophica bacterium]|nr:phosphoribosylformylglycinamidine synthase subunit PurL [Candidatus Omnitrophota bacterium]MBU1924594.1 phosphoribosylformylglycinamidine synthase subunit PurL [Candidatus Omnitrophota bacterium]